MAERDTRYARNRAARGAKKVTFWVEPPDVPALDIITERAGGSVSAAIRQAIKEAAK